MRTVILSLFFICLTTLFASLVTKETFAQFSGSITGSAVSIAINPQFPNPGETITASLDDYSIDTTGATITWLLDGNELSAIRNNRTVTLTAPAAGKTMVLTAGLTFSNKPSIKASVTITPLYVDVIVEPLTYTPVFYAGRALPVHDSLVNLTALVHGSDGQMAVSGLTYNWLLNGNSVYGGPRNGNNRAQITVPYGRNSVITLSVTDTTGKLVARRLISIPSVSVDLEFYEVSTLYGLSQKAIGPTLPLIGQSSTVRAVPYYLDNRAVNNSLYTQWYVNNQKTDSGSDDPFEINLRPAGSGSTIINFKVRNPLSLLQGDEQGFRITN